MVPEKSEITAYMQNGLNEEVGASKTYRMHINSERIYGHIEGREALKQMIYKNLNTEYGVHLIYPTFGISLRDLFGKPKHFAYIELIRRIEECLIKDDRVESVVDFHFNRDRSKKDELSISFTVNSVYGDFEFENTWEFDYDNRG